MRHKNNKYLAFVRSLPCSHCKTPEADPHHIINIGMGGMGTKADDIHTMPLCVPCHAKVHANPKDWIEPQIRWLLTTQNMAQEAGEL